MYIFVKDHSGSDEQPNVHNTRLGRSSFEKPGDRHVQRVFESMGLWARV